MIPADSSSLVIYVAVFAGEKYFASNTATTAVRFEIVSYAIRRERCSFLPGSS